MIFCNCEKLEWVDADQFWQFFKGKQQHLRLQHAYEALGAAGRGTGSRFESDAEDDSVGHREIGRPIFFRVTPGILVGPQGTAGDRRGPRVAGVTQGRMLERNCTVDTHTPGATWQFATDVAVVRVGSVATPGSKPRQVDQVEEMFGRMQAWRGMSCGVRGVLGCPVPGGGRQIPCRCQRPRG